MTPEGWALSALGVGAEIVVGQSPPGDAYNTDARGMPLLNGPTEFGSVSPTPVQWTTHSTKFAEAGDILFCVRGSTTGRQNLADQRYCIGRGLAAVRGRAGSSSTAFLRYVLASLAEDVLREAKGAGSTFPNITSERLHAQGVVLPPLGEQRKIAAILSSVDDAIEATQAVIDQLQVVKKAMMAALLTRGLPGRHTKFKMTEIGEVPEEWEVVRIEALGPEGTPCVRSGPFGSSMKTNDFRPSGTPVLTIQSLGEGVILHGGLFHVDEEKTNELAEYKVRPNDLVFSRVADIGRCAAIGQSENGWLISPNLSRIRLDPAKADAAFLMYSLTAESPVRRQIEMVTGDAGRPVISSGTLKSIALPLPPIGEQHLIVAAGRELEGRLSAEKQAIEATRALKSALMSVLLTGDVRVKPDEAIA